MHALIVYQENKQLYGFWYIGTKIPNSMLKYDMLDMYYLASELVVPNLKLIYDKLPVMKQPK